MKWVENDKFWIIWNACLAYNKLLLHWCILQQQNAHILCSIFENVKTIKQDNLHKCSFQHLLSSKEHFWKSKQINSTDKERTRLATFQPLCPSTKKMRRRQNHALIERDLIELCDSVQQYFANRCARLKTSF